MLTGRIQVTYHAARRYSRRIDRSVTVAQATDLLQEHAHTAAPLRERTPAGDEQWRLDAPKPCVLVIKRDREQAQTVVVVTVLPADAAYGQGNEDDDEQLLQRLIEQQVLESRQGKPRRIRKRRP